MFLNKLNVSKHFGTEQSRHVLAVDFDDFYRQQSFGFHAFRTILLSFLLTLISSISFGDYLNSGAAYTKMSQIGVIPRPASLDQADRPTPSTLCHATLWEVA